MWDSLGVSKNCASGKVGMAAKMLVAGVDAVEMAGSAAAARSFALKNWLLERRLLLTEVIFP